MIKLMNVLFLSILLSIGSCQAETTAENNVENPAKVIAKKVGDTILITPRTSSMQTTNTAVHATEEPTVENVSPPPKDQATKKAIKKRDIDKSIGNITETTLELSIENQRSNATYKMWDAILQAHVSKSGIVNYNGIKSDPNFEKLVSIFKTTDVSAMTKAESKVFWINAYNLFTIKLIVDHWPVKSIMDIASGKPWDVKFINIQGKTYSLNNIENDILRKNYQDPRIHFAINCASYSCPALYSRAFFVGSEESIMNTLAKNFINDPKRNKISANDIEISSIFDWYKTDFTQKGTIIDFLNRYSNTKIQNDAKISYMTYNWNLNNK